MKRMSISILLVAGIAMFASPSIAQTAIDRAQSWNQKIDRFSENLKIKLEEANRRLDALKAKVAAKEDHAEEEVRARLEQLKGRIEEGRTKLQAAQAELKQWAEAQKEAAAAQIDEWKAKHEERILENRAERAERYASASIEVALASIDDAERAALEAWLARQDAN